MKYYFAGLTLCLLLSNCVNNTFEKPGIEETKMARIMADLAIAEAATTGLSGTPKDSLQQFYFNQTLTMHGLTLEQYEKNLQLYANDLAVMMRISEEAEKLVDREKKEEGQK